MKGVCLYQKSQQAVHGSDGKCQTDTQNIFGCSEKQPADYKKFYISGPEGLQYEKNEEDHKRKKQIRQNCCGRSFSADYDSVIQSGYQSCQNQTVWYFFVGKISNNGCRQ